MCVLRGPADGTPQSRADDGSLPRSSRYTPHATRETKNAGSWEEAWEKALFSADLCVSEPKQGGWILSTPSSKLSPSCKFPEGESMYLEGMTCVASLRSCEENTRGRDQRADLSSFLHGQLPVFAKLW